MKFEPPYRLMLLALVLPVLLAAGGPTREETVDFIRDKLETAALGVDEFELKPDGSIYLHRAKTAAVDGCTAYWRRANLLDMRPSHILYRNERRRSFSVVLRCVHPGCVRQTLDSSCPNREHRIKNQQENLEVLTIPFAEERQAKKVERAVAHLIRLLRAEQEVDDGELF